jgi:ATP/maltotriose-dependent transcriptional regulator MalT
MSAPALPPAAYRLLRLLPPAPCPLRPASCHLPPLNVRPCLKPQEFLKGIAIKLLAEKERWARCAARGLISMAFTSANKHFQEGISPRRMFLVDSGQDISTPKLDLITEKIIKPAAAARVSRRRLLEMLEKSMSSGTSTIITGRAGSGKTALAVDFADKCGRPVAWYKVDAPEAEPHLFFQYLTESIREQQPEFGASALMPLIQYVEERIGWLTDAFVYELAEGESAGPLLIVIEDLHFVFDSDWLMPFFSRLLPLLPPDVHVLITSRSLPPAPLWRMRSKQFLVVMEEETLAFTRAEAVSLFESYGLSTEQANIALDHTHGRAVAMDECAAFLQSKLPATTLP